MSAVVATYNGGKRIIPTINKLKKVKEVNEIIIVDDGSTDNTAEIVKKQKVKLISYKPNRGKGYAMRKGVKAAKGDLIVFIDHHRFDPFQIPTLLSEMKKTKANMVVGWRDFRVIPWYRRINIALTKLAIFMGTGKVVRDPISGFRIIPRNIFLKLNTREERYGIEADINYRALLSGMKIIDIPVTVEYPDKSAIKASAFRTWGINLREAMFNVKTVPKIWFGLFK